MVCLTPADTFSSMSDRKSCYSTNRIMFKRRCWLEVLKVVNSKEEDGSEERWADAVVCCCAASTVSARLEVLP